ncbi:MAG: protein kinase [Candidatus Hydrogenedentes bacterium]|nr:protein kinase [Candidatus Hydrogenedentota bacterium]
MNALLYILDVPLKLVENFAGFTLEGSLLVIVRLATGFVYLYILARLFNWVWHVIEGMTGRNKRLADAKDIRALSGQEFTQNIEAAQNLESTIKPLKKDRNWVRLAEVYASLNKHKEAAKYYKKAGQRLKSAESLAKAGYTAKAAQMLAKEGEFDTAARLFTEIGKHGDAAAALMRAGKPALAAASYVAGGKVVEAANAFMEYFNNPTDPVALQVAAAEECYRLLTSDVGKKRLKAEQRTALIPAVAGRFEQAQRYDAAAALYKEAGNPGRAGEVFLLAGRLDEAAASMKEAGREKEASQIVGRFHQSKGNFKEAAAAYVQAGDLLHAAECFAKAADPVRAAECFERVGEFYRAGLAYAHAARFEPAIKALQKVKESDPNFDVSRGLLGRCFYEMHDYPHCAAALDNHLTGKRVDSATVDYFYMLALAYEQLGKLDESREILYKIRTVNVGFRDVAQRISSISSRISIQGTGGQFTPAHSTADASVPQSQVATRVMQSVEENLGGRYILEKELGRGGMGVVYLARDKQLDRPVALKFLGSVIDSSEEYRQRFIREARTAAKINHPNIIAIYDISASVGKAYIAMEYIEGPSLHKYLSTKKGLKPREAVNLIVQTCNALSAIHDAGIVHRDIKPDNILLAKGGLVKLTDFGLAKAEDSRMTQTGVVMGTPSYMAPEQVLGREADVRSDVYALGLVLYECLTGETVFLGQNVLERQLKETPPAPSTVVEGVPPQLDAIILKCVSKQPEDRFQNMKELMAALRNLSL